MTCPHIFEIENKNAIGNYEKREGGEMIYIRGDFERCKICNEGRFVPYQPDLRIVPAEPNDRKS